MPPDPRPPLFNEPHTACAIEKSGIARKQGSPERTSWTHYRPKGMSICVKLVTLKNAKVVDYDSQKHFQEDVYIQDNHVGVALRKLTANQKLNVPRKETREELIEEYLKKYPPEILHLKNSAKEIWQ